MTNKEFYDKKGYVVIENAIPTYIIDELRSRAIKLKNWLISLPPNTPSKYGSPFHWSGLGCAGMYDNYLNKFYQSRIMYEYASDLLGKEDIWLFNDQVVVKLPNESFEFEMHFDNQFLSTNTDGKIHTVNMGVVLDNFTEENGPISIKDMETSKMIRPLAKAGDIIAIHGNTPHASNPNKSDKPRGFYPCVYAEDKVVVDNFYREPFITKYDIL
jgi:ectoine hydroxylase-related dioxygenase (phytanoyl-CoA dioxygenase family)